MTNEITTIDNLNDVVDASTCENSKLKVYQEPALLRRFTKKGDNSVEIIFVMTGIT